MDSYHCEYLGRTFGLIGFDSHLVSGDFLVILLAEDGDHVEARAPGQSGGDQFNRFRASASGGIVQQQVMAASSLGHKLALLLKWLGKIGRNLVTVGGLVLRSDHGEGLFVILQQLLAEPHGFLA
jgi:hypothetical protein